MRERAGGASSWTRSALSRRPTVRTDGFETLGIPLSPERVKLLMRGFLGGMRVKRVHAAVQEAHPEGHHSARTRDTQ